MYSIYPLHISAQAVGVLIRFRAVDVWPDKKTTGPFVQISVQPALGGPISKMGGGGTVGSGWQKFDGGTALHRAPLAPRGCAE